MSACGIWACRGITSVVVFVRDPRAYLREFRRKSPKSPKGLIDERDRGLNLVPYVYQFRAQNRLATGGVFADELPFSTFSL